MSLIRCHAAAPRPGDSVPPQQEAGVGGVPLRGHGLRAEGAAAGAVAQRVGGLERAMAGGLLRSNRSDPPAAMTTAGPPVLDGGPGAPSPRVKPTVRRPQRPDRGVPHRTRGGLINQESAGEALQHIGAGDQAPVLHLGHSELPDPGLRASAAPGQTGLITHRPKTRTEHLHQLLPLTPHTQGSTPQGGDHAQASESSDHRGPTTEAHHDSNFLYWFKAARSARRARPGPRPGLRSCLRPAPARPAPVPRSQQRAEGHEATATWERGSG